MSDVDTSYSAKLAVFQRPFVESAVKDIYYVTASPKNSFSKESSIEFNIPPDSPDYIDLSRC